MRNAACTELDQSSVLSRPSESGSDGTNKARHSGFRSSFSIRTSLPFVRPRLLEKRQQEEANKAEPHRFPSLVTMTDQTEDSRPAEELKNFFKDCPLPKLSGPDDRQAKPIVCGGDELMNAEALALGSST